MSKKPAKMDIVIDLTESDDDKTDTEDDPDCLVLVQKLEAKVKQEYTLVCEDRDIAAPHIIFLYLNETTRQFSARRGEFSPPFWTGSNPQDLFPHFRFCSDTPLISYLRKSASAKSPQ